MIVERQNMIKFLFFAQLADLAERNSLELEYQAGLSACDYINSLAKHLPEPAIAMLRDKSIAVSINQKLASWDDTLSDGDEVGLLPPFSGG